MAPGTVHDIVTDDAHDRDSSNEWLPVPDTATLLRNRSVRAFLFSVTAMTVATMAQQVALGVQVFQITGREIDLGLLGLAEFLPVAVLAPVAGALADRFDRRIVMGAGLLGEAMSSLTLAVLAWRGVDSIGPILIVVVVFGVFRALTAPAARALPATLVPPNALPKVVPLFSASWQVGGILGPIIGGVLYSVSTALPFLIVTALMLVGLVLLPIVRIDPSAAGRLERGAPRPGMGDALDGLRFIRRRPLLLGAISLDLFAVLFGGAIALLPAIADERLGVGSTGLGWLRAAVGIGAATTTVVLAARPVGRHVGLKLLFVVAIFGLATMVLGLTTMYAVAFIALLIGSAADAVSVNIRATLVPLITPDEYRGRVLAVENVFIGASNELGAFESGVAGQILGAAGAVFFGGAATIGVVGVWWVAFPSLRKVDRFVDVIPPDG